jgi:hypothetical protein
MQDLLIVQENYVYLKGIAFRVNSKLFIHCFAFLCLMHSSVIAFDVILSSPTDWRDNFVTSHECLSWKVDKAKETYIIEFRLN